MARDPKSPEPEKYDQVVERLEGVVKRLEAGELSLEDSLKAFEEGIGLVRKGEKLLSAAEKRIEQLLAEDGGERAVALNVGQADKPAPQRETDDGDVPF